MLFLFNFSAWTFFGFLFYTQVDGFSQVERLPNAALEWTNLSLTFLLFSIPIIRFVLRRLSEWN